MTYLVFWIILNALMVWTFASTGMYIAGKRRTNSVTVAVRGAGVLITIFLPSVLESTYFVRFLSLSSPEIEAMCSLPPEEIRERHGYVTGILFESAHRFD